MDGSSSSVTTSAVLPWTPSQPTSATRTTLPRLLPLTPTQEQVLALRGAIRVCVRERPALVGEAATIAGDTSAPLVTFPEASSDASAVEVVELPGPGIGGYGTAETGRRTPFSFHRAFPPTASQGDVFAEVDGLVQSALDGHKVCIFAVSCGREGGAAAVWYG